ncbi:NXPE family member 1-like [Diadema antillarum]|uniref:NXPE family member 1-like n=1 Tax=Diadema antillarum TaxID=105358 RepID=UPI003A89EC5A
MRPDIESSITFKQTTTKSSKLTVIEPKAYRPSNSPVYWHKDVWNQSLVLDTLFSVTVKNTTTEFAQVDPNSLTSAKTSVYYPVHTAYHVGDTVEIRIDAFDEMGLPRSTGGDFWYVRAISVATNFRSIGRIADHQNGSYSAFFLAAVPGQVDIEVILVHPAQAVEWLTDVYMTAEGCFTWAATYVQPGLPNGQGRCVVKRGLNHLRHDNVCFYGANETGMGASAFICTKPSNYACSDIKIIAAFHQAESIELPVKQLIAGKQFLFNNMHFKARLTSPASTSHVIIKKKGSTVLMSLIYEDLRERPHTACGEGDERGSQPLPEGYWLGNQWFSLICANKAWVDHTHVKTCLADYKIIMFGDSIACQWFRVLQRKLDNKVVPNSFYACSEDETHTVKYNRHVLSAALTSPFNFFGIERVFEPEHMDMLPVIDRKYIIFISMSAHYGSWTMDSFRDRMKEIRTAIVRLRARLGADRVVTVVKKSQARDHGKLESRIHSNDYVFRQHSKIMEEEFTGIDAIMLDYWDLVLSYSKETQVHMPWPCINEEVDLFLSYICPR